MKHQCCVPFCKSRKARRLKRVTVYKFPEITQLAKIWKKAIGLRSSVPTKHLRVCIDHFKSDDFAADKNSTRSKKKKVWRKLTASAIPSLLLHKQTEDEQISDEDEDNPDAIKNINDLKSKFLAESLHLPHIISCCDTSDGDLWFLCQKFTDIKFPPKTLFSLKVSSNLSFTAFHNDEMIPECHFAHVMYFSKSLLFFSDFLKLMSFLQQNLPFSSPIAEAVKILRRFADSGHLNDSSTHKLNFLIEQLLFVENRPGRYHRFSTALMTTALVWKSHSTSCYKAMLRDNQLTLPSISTLQRVSSKLSSVTADVKSYLETRMKKLNLSDRTVVLIFDEIYVFQTMDYSNGSFSGLVTSSDQLATSVLCFMMKSVNSPYSDVISLIPVCGINVDLVAVNFHSILSLLVSCGFDVISLVCDNHPVNRSFFNTLANGNPHVPIDHPGKPGSPLHLLIDPTHTFKNIYNNFQKASYFKYHDGEHNDIIRTPKFSHIRQIFEMEGKMALRMAHKLTKIVISPTSVQRASVKLTMAVFHDSTVSALEYYANNGHPEFMDTFYFVKFIADLIKIVNVKSIFNGHRRNDELRKPILSVNDYRLNHLEKCAGFFLEWKNSRFPGLTSETNFAVINMCLSVKNIVTHLLLEKKSLHVLTGFLQSDPIEKRFGRYRQMSGANFFISVKQVIESEKKIKLVSLLKHTKIQLDDFIFHEEDSTQSKQESCDSLAIYLEDCPMIDLDEEELQIVYFVSGYCGKSAKFIECTSCRQLFISTYNMPVVNENSKFFTFINRGKLQAPSTNFFSLCCQLYELFCRLKLSPDFSRFLATSNAALSFVNHSMDFCDAIYGSCYCSLSHDCEHFFRRFIRSFFHTLSRNYVRQNTCLVPSDSKKVKKLSSRK